MYNKNPFLRFCASEKSGGILLAICTIIAILLANSDFGFAYKQFWKNDLGALTLEHWVNDGLMAIFFLLIGLELKRELLIGELSSFKTASLPVVAALGGMVVPALIHYLLNQGTPTQTGIGIPMATDIAFVIGALALLGNKVPSSLKVFVVAFAVIDDLGAIIVIASFYTANLYPIYLLGFSTVLVTLFIVWKVFKTVSLMPYLLGGLVMWWCMFMSGIHATIAGVVLAFAIPFKQAEHSLGSTLESKLHYPVALVILPVFALANTGISLDQDWIAQLLSMNSLGIISGLLIGKPIGILLFSYVAVKLGLCRLPRNITWSHIGGAGILGGIGFTMSIFISNLAFPNETTMVTASKMAILTASITAGCLGILWLNLVKTSREMHRRS